MKGLLLNHELGMWEATLQRRKTNTRRMPDSLDFMNVIVCDDKGKQIKGPSDWTWARNFKGTDGRSGFSMYNETTNVSKIVYPRFQLNEIVFLQEPTIQYNDMGTPCFLYKYEGTDGFSDEVQFPLVVKDAMNKGEGWQNKMFMPEARARYFIKITKIQIDRLQNISIQDAIAEGIQPLLQSKMQKIMDGHLFRDYSKKIELFNSGLPPIESYKSLWVKLNGKESWDNNPWVFSYHYEFMNSRELFKTDKGVVEAKDHQPSLQFTDQELRRRGGWGRGTAH